MLEDINALSHMKVLENYRFNIVDIRSRKHPLSKVDRFHRLHDSENLKGRNGIFVT
jgi:hypothetical protein